MTGIAIFGATSAIAKHTARHLSSGARFFLVARSADKLEILAADLKSRGAASVATATYDFADIAGLKDLAAKAAIELNGIDIGLIAYGDLTRQTQADTNTDYTAKQIELNFTSPANLSQLIANHLAQRKRGILGVITSVAGDRGRARNYTYGAAKGGLGLFLQGLRHRLNGSGVEILDIRPGFVDTPMTADISKNFLFAQPDAVGQTIAEALKNNRGGRLYVPRFWFIIMMIVRNIPDIIFNKTKL